MTQRTSTDAIPDGATQGDREPDWHNAATCIENMQIAYDDALEAHPFEDGNAVPTDTVVDAGDLGVLIDLARYASHHRLAAAPAAPESEVERLREALERLVVDVENGWGDPHTLRHARGALSPAATDTGPNRCTASPDHADIMATIESAADDWQARGYSSALAEVRDMAQVGRDLMERLPDEYHYNDTPAEIVFDLINERDELRAALIGDAA